jgi:hypothetical protein
VAKEFSDSLLDRMKQQQKSLRSLRVFSLRSLREIPLRLLREKL